MTEQQGDEILARLARIEEFLLALHQRKSRASQRLSDVALLETIFPIVARNCESVPWTAADLCQDECPRELRGISPKSLGRLLNRRIGEAIGGYAVLRVGEGHYRLMLVKKRGETTLRKSEPWFNRSSNTTKDGTNA